LVLEVLEVQILDIAQELLVEILCLDLSLLLVVAVDLAELLMVLVVDLGAEVAINQMVDLAQPIKGTLVALYLLLAERHILLVVAVVLVALVGQEAVQQVELVVLGCHLQLLVHQ